MRKMYLAGVLTLFFILFSISVFRMEGLLAKGADALLPLAPVDPRALLTGDYMALEYVVNNDISRALRGKEMEEENGRAVVRLVPFREGAAAAPPLAEFARLDDGTGPLGENECYLPFKVRGRSVLTASPVYYFQEGHASVYERARFGRIKIGADGKTLLAALCDERGENIRPPAEKPDSAR